MVAFHRVFHLLRFSAVVVSSFAAVAEPDPKWRFSPPEEGWPLHFELRGDSGRQLPPRFEYSVEANQDLIIGDKRIPTSAFQFLVDKTDSDPRLLVVWPATFLAEGELVVRHGNEEIWRERLRPEIESAGLEASGKGSMAVAVNRSRLEIPSRFQELGAGKPLRFCVESVGDSWEMSYCSPEARWDSEKGPLVSSAVDGSQGRDRIVINEQEVSGRGSIVLGDLREQIRMGLFSRFGHIFKIRARPASIEFIDVVAVPEGYLLTGQGGPPKGENVKAAPENEAWWQAQVKSSKPELYVLGEGEVPFVHEFHFFKPPPTEELRPFLHPRSRVTTYASTVPLHGQGPRGFRYSTQEASIVANTETGRFTWTVDRLKAGRSQERTIRLQRQGESYYASREIYRAYPYEVSARLTGVTDSAAIPPKILFHSELAAGAWFEKIYGDNHWLSLQRWGVYGRYFSGINGQGDQRFSLWATDLKYRLTPGVWGEDESWGLMVGAANFWQNVDSTGAMVGPGFFWARKMPQFFDAIFNIVPWFRYPKWVDLDFTYYPMSSETGKNVTLAYRLNFHGKMMITPRFFLEAGFGLLSFSWEVLATKFDITGYESRGVTMSYGTGGIGFTF